MVFFSTLWASIGASGLQGWGGSWLTVVIVLIGIILAAAGFSLLFAARNLSDHVDEAAAQRGKRIGMWFGIVFGAEGLCIAIAAIICNAIHRFDLFFPIMSIIVGVHFFPLAALFEVKAYYIVGALFCLLALIALFLVPENARIGSQQITVPWVILGFGAAIILWCVGFGLCLLGRRLLTSHQPQLQPS